MSEPEVRLVGPESIAPGSAEWLASEGDSLPSLDTVRPESGLELRRVEGAKVIWFISVPTLSGANECWLWPVGELELKNAFG